MKFKFDENFDNVTQDLTTVVDVPFKMSNADHDEKKKQYEDAMKTNAKLAEETVPEEGYTGKKVTSPALKKMHLSEALFEAADNSYNDLDLSSDSANKLLHKVYNALSDIIFEYTNDGYEINQEQFDIVLEWFQNHFWEDEYFNDESLTEANKSSNYLNKYVNSLPKKTKDAISKKLKEAGIKDKDYEDAMNSKVSDLEDTIDLNSLELDESLIEAKMSNNFPSRETVSGYNLTATDLEEECDKVEESIKYDIAKEQIKKFNEGLMPKDWTPDKYLNKLVLRKHLTESQAKKLKKELIQE